MASSYMTRLSWGFASFACLFVYLGPAHTGATGNSVDTWGCCSAWQGPCVQPTALVSSSATCDKDHTAWYGALGESPTLCTTVVDKHNASWTHCVSLLYAGSAL